MKTKIYSKTHNFLHETKWICHLIKISKSKDIDYAISKLTKLYITTYPKVGVSCYTWGKLLPSTYLALYRHLAQSDMV